MENQIITENPVFLAGPKNTRNSLLAVFIEKGTGLKCVHIDSLGDVHTYASGNGDRPRLVLWDCYGKDAKDCLDELERAGEETIDTNYVAFFNVLPTLGIERDALGMGVRGIFYIQDPPEHLAKGILAIMKGEIWAPRRIIGECIRKGMMLERYNNNGEALLSVREIQIMRLLVAGLSNKQIADKFCISSYTVKTHLHNIFRKIHVHSRVQAVIWASKNM